MEETEAEVSGVDEPVRHQTRWAADSLLENLQLIADGVVAVAGFAVAAIRVRRGDELELVVDTGLPESRGSRIPLQLMVDELALAEDWGQFQFVPHAAGDTAASGWVVPDVAVSDAPDAWHPMDMLVAPLYDAKGVLRGTFAIDEPLDGRLPSLESRRLIDRFAVLATRAVLASVEREDLAEQVAMADTVKAIVRTTSAQLSLSGLLDASRQTLLEGFSAQYIWIKTVADDHEDSPTEYVPDEIADTLPPDVLAFAESSAGYCWHHQVVMTIGAGYPVPRQMEQPHFDRIVELLAQVGMASLIFVPLGAGPECMGSLVLLRDDADRRWTDVECAALLDIGHDLGRAALNARTFEREHALVAELQALDSYKSQLIATVSHELKSPLTTVAGHLEMLESGTITIGEQAQASLAAIGRASDRMSRVIEDLLLLRKVGESRQPLRRHPVDLGELVRDALELTALNASEKGLLVEAALGHQPVEALGEHEELDKVVHNLVSNAVKYTPSGGRVEISVTTSGPWATLTVRDEGIGISAEDQQNLFTEFFRSTNPVAVAQPGTGLGLAIVRRIVERHGGTIKVESAFGVGSAFSVTVPAAQAAVRDEQPVTAA